MYNHVDVTTRATRLGTCLKAIPSGRKEAMSVLTHVGEVVHQDDLLDEVRRRPVQHGVHRPQQYGPGLVVETHDDGRLWELLPVPAGLLAPGGQVGRR